MSIPKKIHYCWFGQGKKNDLFYKCLESWKKYCPDYEIIEWNESNYSLDNKYIIDAYKENKWAFVTDYVRLDVIYNHGGIYLDTDVELIKSLDELLKYSSFFGVESQDLNIATGLGFGAEKYSDIVKNLRDIYKDISFYKEDGELNLTPCTYYSTKYFENFGYKKNNKTQIINGCKIFPSEVLSPYNYKNGKLKIEKNTISIHWYDASWDDDINKKIHAIEVRIRNKFNGNIGELISFIYRKSYRLFIALKKGEVIELFTKKIKKRNKKNV